MSTPKALADFLNDVDAIGGSYELSHDGHYKIYSRRGTFIVKLRSAGKRVADTNATERARYRQYLRAVVER